MAKDWKQTTFAAFYGDRAQMLYFCVPFARGNKAALREYKTARLYITDTGLELRLSLFDRFVDNLNVFQLKVRPSGGGTGKRYWINTSSLSTELLRTFDLLKYRYFIRYERMPWWKFFLSDKLIVDFRYKTPKRGRVKYENAVAA